jgi:hypothetical protein
MGMDETGFDAVGHAGLQGKNDNAHDQKHSTEDFKSFHG